MTEGGEEVLATMLSQIFSSYLQFCLQLLFVTIVLCIELYTREIIPAEVQQCDKNFIRATLC